MQSLKKRFRKIKKLPTWLFIPPVLFIKFMKFCMKTEIHDPFNSMNPEKFPFITVTWHNRLLFFPAMFPKNVLERTAGIISPSRDGQYISDIVGLFGVKKVIRGSSSKRGFIAFSEAINCLKEGYNVTITPDGPRGPRYRMSNGPVVLASKTGFPVLPISINAGSYWEISSWDRFQIPKPWAKLTLTLGKPLIIPPDLTEAEIEDWRKIVEQQLKEISGCE